MSSEGWWRARDLNPLRRRLSPENFFADFYEGGHAPLYDPMKGAYPLQNPRSRVRQEIAK